MSKVAAFHTTTPEYPAAHREVYHDQSTCSEGKKIKTEHRVSGQGNKKHCAECAKVK